MSEGRELIRQGDERRKKILRLKDEHERLLNSFLENCRISNRSWHTYKNYRADLEKFFVWFEGRYPFTIVRAKGQTISEYKDFLENGGTLYLKKPSFHDNAWKKIKTKFLGFVRKTIRIDHDNFMEWTQKPLAVGSRRRHLSTLKNFFEYLKQVHEDQSKKFSKNPVKPKLHAIKLKDVDVKATMLLRPDDWKKISDLQLAAKNELIVNLLYWGGLRLSEVCELRWDDFDFQNLSMNFTRKGGSVHFLRIENAPEIFRLLARYLKKCSIPEGGGQYLFPNRRGGAASSRAMYSRLMNIFKRAGCREGLTPHSFRKAAATRVYLRTRDLLFTRDYLNHADAKVTQTYIDKNALAEKSIADYPQKKEALQNL